MIVVLHVGLSLPMRAAVVLAAVAVARPLMAAPPLDASSEAQAAGRWEVSAAAATATPLVLPQGLSLGATIELRRRLAAGPYFVSARAGWTAASAANVAWIIDHQQLVAALGAGAAARVGAGHLWAQAGGGAAGLYEVLSRHQRERVDAAGVPGGSESAFALGPYAFAEAGVGVEMRGRVSGFIAAGPALSRSTVAGSARWRLGGFARLGVACEF